MTVMVMMSFAPMINGWLGNVSFIQGASCLLILFKMRALCGGRRKQCACDQEREKPSKWFQILKSAHLGADSFNGRIA